MEQLGLTRQLFTVGSPRREAYPNAHEQIPAIQQLRSAFYSIADALLNITEGPNGQAVVDISRQPNRFEWAKSQIGLGLLSTMDWLGQVASNIAKAHKQTLLVQSATGMMGALGVPMLHNTDFYHNPLYPLVLDTPHQEGAFSCDVAQVAAQNLCSAGVVGGGVIVECPVDSLNPGRVQINLMNPEGGLMVSPLNDNGVAESTSATTCSTIGVDVVPVAPTIPAVAPTEGSAEQIVPDYAATPGVPDVTCVENPLIGTYDVAAVIAGFRQACGVDISPDMAQKFLDATGAEGTDGLYGGASADQLALWVEQQWLRFGDQMPEATVPTSTSVQEATPLAPREICNLTDPGLEDAIVVDFSDINAMANDLYERCGIYFPDEQTLNSFITLTGVKDPNSVVEIPLELLKEYALYSGATIGPTPEAYIALPPTPALATPVAFEGVPPTPALATPIVGGEQVAPEGEGFWDLDLLDKYKNWVNGFPRETRILVNMLNILVVSMVLLGASGLFRIIRKEQRNSRNR